LLNASCDAHVPGPFARQPSTAPNVGPPARARHPATRLGADHGGTHAQAQRRPVLARQRPPGQASASPCCPLTPEPAGSRSRVDPDDALREAVAKDHRVPLTGRGPGACSGAGAHLGMSAPKAHHPARLAGTLLSCRSSSSTSQSVPTGAAAQPTESRVEPLFVPRLRFHRMWKPRKSNPSLMCTTAVFVADSRRPSGPSTPATSSRKASTSARVPCTSTTKSSA